MSPRDPTTGRFLPYRQDGREDDSVIEAMTDLCRAARGSFGLESEAIFVELDEIGDTAPSPEDILLAAEDEAEEEVELEDVYFDDDEDNEFVCIDDTIDDTNEVGLVEISPKDDFCDQPRRGMGNNRSSPPRTVSAHERREIVVSRMRRARRASDPSHTWLDEPGWSYKAAVLLKIEEIADRDNEAEAIRADYWFGHLTWDEMKAKLEALPSRTELAA